jgi:hypothetical protein
VHDGPFNKKVINIELKKIKQEQTTPPYAYRGFYLYFKDMQQRCSVCFMLTKDMYSVKVNIKYVDTFMVYSTYKSLLYV